MVFSNRQPVNDISPQGRQMIKDRPAVLLFNDLLIFYPGAFLYDRKELILNSPIAVKILSRIISIIKLYLADLTGQPGKKLLLR